MDFRGSGHGGSLSLTQFALLRSAGGLGLALCLLPTIGKDELKPKNTKLQFTRIAACIGYMFAMMYSLTKLSLADATALSYTQAIWIVVLAIPILHEVIFLNRWIGAIAGLLGAICLIQPSFDWFSVLPFLVLLGMSQNALALVLTKYLQRSGEHPLAAMLYVNLGVFLFFLPAIFLPWPGISWWYIAPLVIGPLGMYVGIIALRYAEASVLAPYTYTRLLAAWAIGPLIFSEIPNLLSLVGAIVIVAACLISSYDPARASTTLGPRGSRSTEP
jgi:drug/metabolite transporter (DMT)-like permease